MKSVVKFVAVDLRSVVKRDAACLLISLQPKSQEGGGGQREVEIEAYIKRAQLLGDNLAGGPNSKKNVYDQSNEIQNIHDVQSKYMNKVKNRLGGSLLPLMEKHVQSQAPKGKVIFRKETDAQTLRDAKNYASSNPEQSVDKEAVSFKRWLLGPNFGHLFDNFRHRGIPVAIIVDPSTLCDISTPPSSPPSIGANVDYSNNNNHHRFDVIDAKIANIIADETIKQVERTVASDTLRSWEPNGGLLFKIDCNDGGLEEKLSSIMEEKGIAAPNILVISSADSSLLKTGRALSCHNIFYRTSEIAPPSTFPSSSPFPTTKVAYATEVSSVLEVQDILENLNGVSFRDEAANFRISAPT